MIYRAIGRDLYLFCALVFEMNEGSVDCKLAQGILVLVFAEKMLLKTSLEENSKCGASYYLERFKIRKLMVSGKYRTDSFVYFYILPEKKILKKLQMSFK